MRLFFILFGAVAGLLFGGIAIKEAASVATQIFFKQEYLVHTGQLGVIFMTALTAVVSAGIGIHALLNKE